MANATRFTNLEVTGDMTLGLARTAYTATSADAAEAASTAPTKAEFDAVVALLNELKSKYNALVVKLTPGA